MFLALLIFNFFVVQKMHFKKKADYLFALHPLLTVVGYLIMKVCIFFMQHYFTKSEEKKVLGEIPNLIDFLKSYLQAGCLLPQALLHVSHQRKWCHPISHTLGVFCAQYAYGKSFSQCIVSALSLCQNKKSRQHLAYLYASIKLSYCMGDNVIELIDKVKHKTQEKINLNRKLKITTAQMRLQAFVILISPLFLTLIIYFISPTYILIFFNTKTGLFLLIIMFVLYTLAIYFLKKILKVQ